MTRLALFSDVHGNADALQAVLADLQQHQVEQIIFAGDLVYGGYQPRQCIDLLQRYNVAAVYGNTDEFFWVEKTRADDTSDEAWAQYQAYLAWVNDQIGTDGLDYLQAMPFKRRIQPTDHASDTLLVVHANPHDVQRVIFPNLDIQQAKGRIRQDDTALRALLGTTPERYLAFGHIHMPNIRTVDDYTLFNISSVNKPQDGDWRAKYAILTFEAGTWTLDRHYVDYDVAAYQRAMRASAMPMRDTFA